jgi:hypothetical protein
MKSIQNLLLLIAGALLCLVVEGFLKARPVHAEDQLSSGTVCVAQVPIAWGEFRGSSELFASWFIRHAAAPPPPIRFPCRRST